jgi:hypothetical protein
LLKPKKKLPDEIGAKVAFEMSIEHLARLAIFSKSAHSSLSFATSIGSAIEFQFRSDLILASIALRRTGDLINCNKELSKLTVKEARRSVTKKRELNYYYTKSHHKFSELLNKIVHHRVLQVLDNEILETNSARDMLVEYKRIQEIQSTRRAVETLISISSDKGVKLTFALTDFVKQALEFLEIAEEKLAGKDIWVGSRQFG